MPKKVTIGGKQIVCLTISEFAARCNKTTSGILSMEKRGKIPKPNIVIPHSNSKMPGNIRLYSESLVLAVSPIIQKWRRYRKSTEEEIAEIKGYFDQERRSIEKLSK